MAATANFWQARPPHQRCAAAPFYSPKFRQGLGGLASRGGPALSYPKKSDVQAYSSA